LQYKNCVVGILSIFVVNGVEDGAKNRGSKTSGGTYSTVLIVLNLMAALVVHKEFQ
jgi:hypothetical protein